MRIWANGYCTRFLPNSIGFSVTFSTRLQICPRDILLVNNHFIYYRNLQRLYIYGRMILQKCIFLKINVISSWNQKHVAIPTYDWQMCFQCCLNNNFGFNTCDCYYVLIQRPILKTRQSRENETLEKMITWSLIFTISVWLLLNPSIFFL